jgi:RNA polymerase sigma-70 factor (ECF subfamily)
MNPRQAESEQRASPEPFSHVAASPAGHALHCSPGLAKIMFDWLLQEHSPVSDSSDSRTSATLLGRLRKCPTDQAAWEQFVGRYGPKIYGWCRRWNLQDADAQDVAQIVLLRLATHIRNYEYDPSRSFRAWLRTVTHNAWIDFVSGRKNKKQAGELLDSVQARDDLVVRMEEAYDRELLEEAMSRVRLRVQVQTWEAFQLMAIQGLPGAEAAARLDMKVTSVFKAKSNVQKLIQEEVCYLDGAVSP